MKTRPEWLGDIDPESDAELFTFGAFDPLSADTDTPRFFGRVIQVTASSDDVCSICLERFNERAAADGGYFVYSLFKLWKQPGWALAEALYDEPDEIKLKTLEWLYRHRRYENQRGEP